MVSNTTDLKSSLVEETFQVNVISAVFESRDLRPLVTFNCLTFCIYVCLSTNFDRTAAQVEKSISLIFCTKIGPSEKLNGLQLVCPDTASFRRNMQKTISPRLGSKSTSG